MSKGTVTLLVIVFVVCISCGAGYAAYRIVREKLRRLSRMAFGTDSITEGLEQQAKELAVTPKSVSAMTRIFLPQIQRDFPDFHIEQFKDKVENALMLALQAISAADAGIFERQIKDGVSEEFLAQIKNRIRENETEAVTEHYEQIQIHQNRLFHIPLLLLSFFILQVRLPDYRFHPLRQTLLSFYHFTHITCIFYELQYMTHLPCLILLQESSHNEYLPVPQCALTFQPHHQSVAGHPH